MLAGVATTGAMLPIWLDASSCSTTPCALSLRHSAARQNKRWFVEAANRLWGAAGSSRIAACLSLQSTPTSGWLMMACKRGTSDL